MSNNFSGAKGKSFSKSSEFANLPELERSVFKRYIDGKESFKIVLIFVLVILAAISYLIIYGFLIKLTIIIVAGVSVFLISKTVSNPKSLAKTEARYIEDYQFRLKLLKNYLFDVVMSELEKLENSVRFEKYNNSDLYNKKVAQISKKCIDLILVIGEIQESEVSKSGLRSKYNPIFVEAQIIITQLADVRKKYF
jgi:hypothetical protein